MSAEIDVYEEDGFQPDVAIMPPPPRGHRARVSAEQLMAVSGDMAAVTLERSAAQRILRVWQTNAVQVGLDSLPEIVKMIQDAANARIMRIEQQVQALHRFQQTQFATGIRGALGFTSAPPPGTVVPQYVSLDQVAKILSDAKITPPAT